MGRAPGEEGPSAPVGEYAPRQPRSRARAVEAEPRHRNRVAGDPERAEKVGEERAAHPDERLHQPPVPSRVRAQPRGRVRD